jgi:hypothetical protein
MPANGAFSPTLPGFQTYWDSTSLGALKRCPRFYQYSLIEGWAPRLESAHLTFGLHYHAGIERYDHARASGASHEAAVLVATRYLLEVTWNKNLGRPWTSDDKNKNRFTLVRSVVWYLEQFADDPFETIILADGKPAVELSFRYQTDIEFGGESIWLCGHLDRVAKLGDDIFILDKKTTKSTIGPDFFEKFTPDNQMSLYSLAGKVVYNLPIKGIVVDGVQIAVTFSRFMRGTVYRHDSQLDEWYQDFQSWLGQAYSYAIAQHWPMNEASCGNYGGCQFREVCSKPPNVRDKWKVNLMQKRVWDPTIPRGNFG